jgi:FlgD Ig-like domain
MRYKFCSISTFCATILLINLSSLATQACPSGNPRDTIYQRRDQNRCEGVNPSIRVNTGLNLVSLVTRSISEPLGDIINLQVPRVPDISNPIVSLNSQVKRYQLDNLILRTESSRFTFAWPTYVLKQEKVPVNALRALAVSDKGSQRVLTPVTIGKSSGKYEFVLRSNAPVKIRTFQILSPNGQIIYTSPSRSSQGGEIIFTWDGRKKDKSIAPKGRYKLKIAAEEEQYDRPPEPSNIDIQFEHHPNWLR